MSIIDTSEKNISNVEWKYDTWKVHTFVVNSYSTIFSYSVHAMYNRVNGAKTMSYAKIIHS